MKLRLVFLEYKSKLKNVLCNKTQNAIEISSVCSKKKFK